MSLMKRFYEDRYLHFRSFSLSLLTATAACALLVAHPLHDFSTFGYSPWQWALVPLGIYWGGVSAVFINNATHGSFRPRWLNWWAGNLAGLHQLWGFTGWKLIHLIHHHYSDDVNHDPHPPKNHTFWQFARIMFVYSSQKISERYREHFGDTPKTRRVQSVGVKILMAMMAMNLLFWFLLLGPAGFVFFYIPSYVANHLLFVDINYTAHPKDESGNTSAANLNDTLYYKLANLMWFGIYFHGNHHRKPLLFNPRYMPARVAKPKEEKLAA